MHMLQTLPLPRIRGFTLHKHSQSLHKLSSTPTPPPPLPTFDLHYIHYSIIEPDLSAAPLRSDVILGLATIRSSAHPHPPNLAVLRSTMWLYNLFFLWIEPVATAVGAYYAHFDQASYMSLTMELATSTTTDLLRVSTQESIVLSQLANMYFVFALNEALVLRATTDIRVWRTFLLGLLIADFGHIWSVKVVGWHVYYRFWDWNSMYWGNLGFVYIGAALRSAFLLGLGLPAKLKA